MSGPLGLDEVRMKVEFQKNDAVGSRERVSLQSAPRLNVPGSCKRWETWERSLPHIGTRNTYLRFYDEDGLPHVRFWSSAYWKTNKQ